MTQKEKEADAQNNSEEKNDEDLENGEQKKSEEEQTEQHTADTHVESYQSETIDSAWNKSSFFEKIKWVLNDFWKAVQHAISPTGNNNTSVCVYIFGLCAIFCGSN